jgi:RNA polymerase sigma factor (sigma-70 family)
MRQIKPKINEEHFSERFTEPSYRADLPSDAELLELYLVGGCRESLITLVKRYSPLVASVVRRMVSNLQDAEDAFQATFLVFLQSADKIQKQGSVAAWLYGVAYRVSSRVRQKANRNRCVPSSENDIPDFRSENPLANLARQIEMESLDYEIQQLPQSLRGPLIEHYIMGYTANEIADRLDVSVSAIEGRLRRGRKLLRYRLAMRGTSLSIVLAGAAWFRIQSAMAAECVAWTTNLIESTASFFQGVGSLSSSNLQTSHLVKGELAMKTIVSTKSLSIFSVATISVIAITGVTLAFQGSNRKAETRPLALKSATVNENNSEALAQTSGAGLAGGGGGGGEVGLGEAGSGESGITTGGGLTGAAGMGDMGYAGMQGAGAGVGIPRNKALTKPEGKPDWLASGRSDRERIEDNRTQMHQSEVKLDFNKVPLAKLIDQLEAESGLVITIDTMALEEEGTALDEPLTLNIAVMPLSEALEAILDPLGLTYEVHERYIKVTTKSHAKMAVRFYDLAFILPSTEALGDVKHTIEQVVDEEWEVMGGTGSISTIGSMMVVRCGEKAHREIEKLLAELEKMQPENFFATEKDPIQPVGGLGGGMGGGGMF